jgi:hypothetical protein
MIYKYIHFNVERYREVPEKNRVSCKVTDMTGGLFHGHRLGQVARLVDIAPAQDRHMIGQKL